MKIKRILCAFFALITVFSFAFALNVGVSAASISSNKHTATGVKGGQTVYIKTNTGWNTELFGNTFRTKVQITLPKAYFEYFQWNLSTGKYAKMQVTTYKKTSSGWSKQSSLSGTFNCNNKGVLSTGASAKTFVLPGKGVQYKMVITPKVSEPVTGMVGYKASDYTNIKVQITSYGTITSVS